MIKIVEGLVRATDEIDMPSSSTHALWKGSKLQTMIQFGGGVTIPAIDDKLSDFIRRARSLSAEERDFWARLRSDRDRLKRTQNQHEELA